MKSLTRMIPVITAALLLFSLPAPADEGMGQSADQGAMVRKDECLIVAKNCAVESVDARIERIEREISKGTEVYTNEELNKLERELRDATRIQKIQNNEFPAVVL